MTDPLLRVLARLPDAEPDLARGERVRARCHAALARRRRPATAPLPRLSAGVLAFISLVYLVAVIREALAIYGV